MNAKDFLKRYGTPEKEILTSTDSAQLVILVGLHEHDYVVQNERYLNQGLDLQVGFSMRFDGLKEPNSSQKAKTLFRGDEPEFMCVSIKRNFRDNMKMIRLLLSFLPAWRSLDIVPLEAVDAPLGEGARALIKDLGMNPLKVFKSERSVCSMGLGTEFFPWIFRVTATSNQSHKFPTMKILKLPEKGRSPEELIFEEPEMPANTFAVQSHVSWSADLYTFLNSSKELLDEVPGSDPKSTKYVFAQLDKDGVFNLVDTFGGKPRFALMTVGWNEGTGVDRKPTIYELFTQKEHRARFAPQMFGFVLSTLWQQGEVFTNSLAAIQHISYDKVRVGLTPDTRKMLLAKIDEMSMLGYILKDEETLDYVTAFDRDETDVSSIMSEWGSVDVCYLIGPPPPYWKESAIRQVLNASGQKEFLLTKMRWSVAEMRFATWKIQALDVKPLMGKVFRTQSKERQMMIISKEDYKQHRRPTTRSNLLSTNTRKASQPEDTTLAFEFKRKRDPPPS